jgi:hypothetical protein
MDKLPEFPQMPWRSSPIAYQTARADAWESRCRLAVEALTTLLPHVKHTDECAFGSNNPECFCGALPSWRHAKATLVKIGPLPSQVQP